jgi:hypothetical protein
MSPPQKGLPEPPDKTLTLLFPPTTPQLPSSGSLYSAKVDMVVFFITLILRAHLLFGLAGSFPY